MNGVALRHGTCVAGGSQHVVIVTDYPRCSSRPRKDLGLRGGLDRRTGDVPPDAGGIDLPQWAYQMRRRLESQTQASAASRPCSRIKLNAFSPCTWCSPNSESFHPPNEWNAIGTGTGTLISTMPTCTPRTKRRAAAPEFVNTAVPFRRDSH